MANAGSDNGVGNTGETAAVPGGVTPSSGKPFRRRHSLGQRIVLGVSVLVITSSFVGAGVLLVAKRTAESFLSSPDLIVNTTTSSIAPTTTLADVDPTDTVGGTEPVETASVATFPAADPAAKNFLITGADNNGCIDPNSPYYNAVDPNRPGNERSDTVMVIRVDPGTQRAAVLSFPRDLFVRVDGRGKARINEAYVKGDPTRLVNTIYNNFGIVVDYAIQIDFCAFKQMVEAVGGVTIPFAHPTYDHNTQLNVTEPGCHTMGGDEALAYVRSRHLHYIDDKGKDREDLSADLGRISRQQDFLRRLLRAALDKGLLNPSVAGAIIESLQQYIVRSNDLTFDVMLGFLGVIRNVDPASVPTYQVAGTNKTVSGAAVLIPTVNNKNMKAILAIFKGEAPLAGAPVQILEPPADTGVATTTTASGATTTTAATVVGPDENTFGLLPPDESVFGC